MRDDIYESILKGVRHKASLYEDLDDELVKKLVSEEVSSFANMSYLDISKRRYYKKKIFNAIRGFGIIQDLIDEDSISEIMVNSADDIFVEQGGRIRKLDYGFDKPQDLEHIIQSMVSKVDRTVNESVPIVDARLEDGSRINVVLPPIALDGATLTIRKFPKNPLKFEDLIENKTISKEALSFLSDLVKRRCNIFISGGTSSGKTTFLNVLSNAIPENERIITIEDSAELNIQRLQNVVRMESRNRNFEGRGEISIRDLIKTSLRMRPDRIIVGEVRGEEVFDMLQAMNTGHDGSLSTGHSNSSVDMLSRLETMMLMSANMPLKAIRQMIVSGIDLMVHLSKMADGKRRVVEICSLDGLENGEFCLKKIYKYDKNVDCLIKVGDYEFTKH